MGKSRRGTKEFSREQKLLNENKKLKQTIGQMRKHMARMELNRHDYESMKELMEEHQTEAEPVFGANFLDNLKKTWLCNDCRQGHLEIILYNKIDNTYYYRKCSNCPNRTKSQKYSPNVQGIIKKATVNE